MPLAALAAFFGRDLLGSVKHVLENATRGRPDCFVDHTSIHGRRQPLHPVLAVSVLPDPLRQVGIPGFQVDDQVQGLGDDQREGPQLNGILKCEDSVQDLVVQLGDKPGVEGRVERRVCGRQEALVRAPTPEVAQRMLAVRRGIVHAPQCVEKVVLPNEASAQLLVSEVASLGAAGHGDACGIAVLLPSFFCDLYMYISTLFVSEPAW